MGHGEGSSRGRSSHSKLALLAAAAVVFAPGPQASDAVNGRPTGAELAARILAPTFDEASPASQAESDRAYKRNERAKPDEPSSQAHDARFAASLLGPPEPLWMALSAVLLLVPILQVLSTRTSRGPPDSLSV
jgi:hypothetical protein